MSKTPEELAEEYMSKDNDKVACAAINHAAEHLVKAAFLAGYQAGYKKGYCDAANTDWDSIVEQAYKQLDKNNENT
jgi:flagellar biosynthesis/type III secretory pathway protein FliH